MKKKISIGVIVIVIVTAIYFALAPTKLAEHTGNHTLPAQALQKAPETETAEKTAVVQEAGPTGKDLHYEQMQAAYDRLEQHRHELKSRLGDLKARLWDLRLPAEQAREVTNTMGEGYKLLKNPPMLGAFSEVEDIEKEISRVARSLEKLQSVESIINQSKDNN